MTERRKCHARGGGIGGEIKIQKPATANFERNTATCVSSSIARRVQKRYIRGVSPEITATVNRREGQFRASVTNITRNVRRFRGG